MRKLLHSLRGQLSMFHESVKMSVSNIAHNRLRSFLTVLGIMIGVTAVIALITTINGVSGSISDSFASLGAGTLTLRVSGNDMQAGLTPEDLPIFRNIEHLDGITPSVSLKASVATHSASGTDITTNGYNAYYFEQNPKLVKRGRPLSPIDINAENRVCLISDDIVEDYFYAVDPIGQTLYVNNMIFTVIGLLDSDADGSITSLMGGASDIIMPYTTAMKLNGTNLITSLTIYVDVSDHSDAVQESIEKVLDPLFNYEDDTYTFISMASIGETMDTLLGMMSALLAGIASIALVVGGIGIMNMMLTSVTERTVEIGLKKAIGAQPGVIQLQFLIESFLLSMLGGVAGVILGILLSALLCSIMGTAFSVSYFAIALGVGFSAAVGIIFGWSPARKASKLRPIDALRSL